MKEIYRFAACAALCVACACLAACAGEPQSITRKPSTIYIYEPKIPPGMAGPGGFDLSPDGKVTIKGSAPSSAQ